MITLYAYLVIGLIKPTDWHIFIPSNALKLLIRYLFELFAYTRTTFTLFE